MRFDVDAAARRLVAQLDDGARAQLAADPADGVGTFGLRIHALDLGAAHDECTCDGAYFPGLRAICYVPTPSSRRENFTILHEFGHHLARSDDDLLSELADFDNEGGVALEERICDAVAGQLLIPDTTVDRVVAGRKPRAQDVLALYEASAASLEACAVRLASRMRCEGYMALLDRDRSEVRFASASPETEHAWGRHSPVPIGHAAWLATPVTGYLGEGDVVWRSGNRRRLWLDAVDHGRIVVAVFASTRYWTAPGLSLLDDVPVTRASQTVMSGTCRHCGGPAYGTRACPDCGDPPCKRCGRCGCGAPLPPTRTCSQCHLVKGKAQFRPGTSICKECLGS